MKGIKDLSIKFKLVSSFSLILLLIFVFQIGYYPSHEKKLVLGEVNAKIRSLTDIVGMGVGIGLGTGNLPVIGNVFNLAKGDSTLDYIMVLNDEKTKIAEFNPNQRELAFSESVSFQVPYNDGEVIHYAKPIEYESKTFGYVALGLSLESVKKSISANRTVILLIGLLIFGIGVGLALIIGNILVKPIISIVKVADEISNGNLSIEDVEIRNNDEGGQLGISLNNMKARLVQIITQIRANTNQVVSTTNEISSTSNQLAAGAEEQTSQASEVAASVQEMTAAILQNSQNAIHTAEIAKVAKDKAHEGSKAMQETRQGMEEIVGSTDKTARVVASLSHRAEQIGEIVQVIDDIADQTNLLALNAAIEAARAGEQGRGFAVVADEVRKLAERTTKATGEIADTIKAIQLDTNEASQSMAEANELVKKGKAATVKTEQVLHEIVASVTQAMDMISQIAAATEQMSSGAEEISKNVESINSVTKDSAVGAEQMAATAEQLTRQTGLLRSLVDQFRLHEDSAKSGFKATHNGGLSEVVVDAYGKMRGKERMVPGA